MPPGTATGLAALVPALLLGAVALASPDAAADGAGDAVRADARNVSAARAAGPAADPDERLTSSAPAAPAAEPAPRRFTVVIDPGHGGRDPGTSARSGLHEKTLTLDIARRARFFLEAFGDVDVVLTREDDVALPLAERVAAIREARADLLVSLHLNHLPQADVVLVESYHAEPRAGARRGGSAAPRPSGPRRPGRDRDGTPRGDSARFAEFVQRRVHDEVSRRALDAVDAGVKREDFRVLSAGRTPGALIELTCLSHAGEAERLREPRYRARLAAALVDAIRDYRVAIARTPPEPAAVGPEDRRRARASGPAGENRAGGAASLVVAPLPRAGRF